MLEIACRRALWLAAAVLLVLQGSLPADASVTCMVRKRGTYVCTFFCRDGFICDKDNLICLPGPRLKQELSDLKEKARVAALASNRVQTKSARETNSKLFGYDRGSTYYSWNGDPREMPTPRHRQGGGFTPLPSGGYSTARQTVRQSLQTRLAAVRSSGGAVALPSVPSGGSSDAGSGASGRSSAPPTASPKQFPKYWEGVDYTDYCANANGVDRTSAYYGYYCAPDSTSTSQDQSAEKDKYQPFPDPKDLDRKVSQICGVYSRETQQCYFQNKLRIVLDTNPDIRDACANVSPDDSSLRNDLRKRLGQGDGNAGDKTIDPNENAYTRCVDDAYLHGLQRKPDGTLREALRQRLSGQEAENKIEPLRPPPEKLPNDGCPPGSGLQPDRTAFGAWTCQPLGGDVSAGGSNPGNGQGAAADNAQDQANADPSVQELNDYLAMMNSNSGGNLRGDLGNRQFSWGADDYRAIEKLQQ
jgi:hypothetical protein